MNNLINHHVQAIKLVLARMQQNLLSSSMICLVVAVAMCVPGLFYLGVDHFSKFTNHMQDETEISLFLKLNTSTDTIADIDAILAKKEGIKHFHLVTKEEAWQKLQDNSDTNSAIQELTKNPLPDAFFIQPNSNDPETLNALKNELQSILGVEQALLNAEWAKRLSTLLVLAKKIISFIAVLLAIALLIVIGNTVRMQILTQKDEIEVSNLMGATKSFIRTPFLYAGMLYGLAGGILAVLMIAAVVQMFNYSVMQISSLYKSDLSLNLFNTNLSLTIIVVAIFIGWLASYLAVTKSITSFKIN